MIDLIKSINAKLEWSLKKGTKKLPEVIIEEVPEEWENFLDTNSKWKRNKSVEEILPVTSCMYLANKNEFFPAHYHSDREETIFVRKGSIYIITPEYSIKLLKNQSHTIKAGVPHYCEFSKEEDCIYEISWSPKLKGWKANFVN